MEANDIGRRFQSLGYKIYSTSGTCKVLKEHGILAHPINKIEEPSPTLLDLILEHHLDLVIDIPNQGIDKSHDGFLIRRHAIETGVTCLTSLDTANALLTSLENGTKDFNVINIAEI